MKPLELITLFATLQQAEIVPNPGNSYVEISARKNFGRNLLGSTDDSMRLIKVQTQIGIPPWEFSVDHSHIEIGFKDDDVTLPIPKEAFDIRRAICATLIFNDPVSLTRLNLVLEGDKLDLTAYKEQSGIHIEIYQDGSVGRRDKNWRASKKQLRNLYAGAEKLINTIGNRVTKDLIARRPDAFAQ